MPNQTSNLKIPYALPGDKPAKFPTETSKPLADRLEKLWSTPKREQLYPTGIWSPRGSDGIFITRFGAFCTLSGLIDADVDTTSYTDVLVLPEWARPKEQLHDFPILDYRGQNCAISLQPYGALKIIMRSKGSTRINLSVINPWITFNDYPTI